MPHLDWELIGGKRNWRGQHNRGGRGLAALVTTLMRKLSLRRSNGRLAHLPSFPAAIIGAGGAACTALLEFARIRERKQHSSRATLKPPDHWRKDSVLIACRYGRASFEKFEVVVNATAACTIGEHQNESAALAAQLRGVRLVYDLVYNPKERVC